jgi:hypothetical protein
MAGQYGAIAASQYAATPSASRSSAVRSSRNARSSGSASLAARYFASCSSITSAGVFRICSSWSSRVGRAVSGIGMRKSGEAAASRK